MYRLKKMLVRAAKFYALDPRALSLMRIGLALVILSDLIIRVSDLQAHYTDDGVWPLRVLHSLGWRPGFWSVHGLSGTDGWIIFLFAIHFLFAVFLLLGYRSRLAAFMVWLLYISLHNRNLFINQAGDDLIRLTLFWGFFLPWDHVYAVDAKRKKNKVRQRPLANLGYLLLLASVYFFTACLKSGPEWRSDYTAVYYALSLEQLRMPFLGEWLYRWPALMKALTFATFYIELLLPFLILFPSRKGYLRLLAFLLLFLLHGSIGMTLFIGLFYIINIVTAIGLLPSFVFEKLEQRFSYLKKLGRNLYASAKPAPQSLFVQNSVRLICFLAIALSLIQNLSSVRWFKYEFRDEVVVALNTVRFDQYWGMFSPNVLKRDGWYVYYGMDSVGRQWDLRRNSDYVSFDKPESILKIHRSDRWRKLTENLQRDDMIWLRPFYCGYKLREWNRSHPEKKMHSLTLYYMQQESLPDYRKTPVEKVLFCTCEAH